MKKAIFNKELNTIGCFIEAAIFDEYGYFEAVEIMFLSWDGILYDKNNLEVNEYYDEFKEKQARTTKKERRKYRLYDLNLPFIPGQPKPKDKNIEDDDLPF